MIEIHQIVDNIQHSFNYENQNDLILDVFILGSLYKQNKKENKIQFKHLVDQIKILREKINLHKITRDRVSELFDQYYEKDQDIFSLFQKLKQQSQGQLQNSDPKQILNGQKAKKIEEQIQQNYEKLQQFQKINFDQGTNQQYLKQDQKQIVNELEDYEIALKLQKQFNDEMNQKSEIQNFKSQNLYLLIQQQDKPIQCSICLDIIELNQIILLSCMHQFHHECINQHCLTQIQSRSFPIICPIIECKENINYSDLKEILEDQVLQTFQKYTFQQYVDTHSDEYSWCPTPDCQYVFIAGSTQFNCPVCKKEYCLNCKVEYHQKLTCQEYMDNQKQQKFNASNFPSNLNNLAFNQNNHAQNIQPLQMIGLPPQQNQMKQLSNLVFQNNQYNQFTQQPLNVFNNQIKQNYQNQLNQINQIGVYSFKQINKNSNFKQIPLQNNNQGFNQNLKTSQQFFNIQFNPPNIAQQTTNEQQKQFSPQPLLMQFQLPNKVQTKPIQNQINNNSVGNDQKLNSKQLDDQFANLMMISKCKQCPNCKSWVEKSSGCDHMTCRCKFQFCYACGGVYGKCSCRNKLYF